jgi:hypothetical protein
VLRGRRGLGCLLLLAVLALLVGGSSALASSRDDGWPVGDAGAWQADEPGPHARLSGDRIWGLVPSELNVASDPHRPHWSDFAGTSLAATAPLTYHGGSVMLTNSTFAIYWLPAGSTVSSNYSSLIDRFFGDVAAASGATNNVYSADTQYYQGASQTPIQYKSTFGGSVVDTSPIPDHCSSVYVRYGLRVSGCVNDADIQAEVSKVAAQQGWTPGPTTMFLVFTPRNVGSCIDNAGTCSYTYYCAYHGNFYDSSSRDVLYANQPYPDTNGVGAPSVCDSGQHPNGDWADPAINLISHEHNEAITDPNGDAWYDSSGNENGDKCAWNFGSSLGSTAYGSYNQVINGDDYYVQQEWSNASSSCVLSYAPPAAPTLSGFTPTSGPAGTTVTLTGSGFTGATAVAFNGVSAQFSVTSPTQISATVPASAATGPISVTTPGGTATSSTSFVVTVGATPDFTVSVSPASQSVSRGRSVSYTVSISPSGGFSQSVQLQVSGLPNRTSASWSQNPIPAGSTSSTLTLSTNRKTSTGSYTPTVTATGGGSQHTAQFTLVVQ